MIQISAALLQVISCFQPAINAQGFFFFFFLPEIAMVTKHRILVHSHLSCTMVNTSQETLIQYCSGDLWDVLA